MPSNLNLLFTDQRADFAMVFLATLIVLVFILGSGSPCPEGLSVDESLNACLDNSTLDKPQYRAASIAVENFESSETVIVEKVVTLRCPGCFKVQLRKRERINNLTIMDWSVEDSTGWE